MLDQVQVVYFNQLSAIVLLDLYKSYYIIASSSCIHSTPIWVVPIEVLVIADIIVTAAYLLDRQYQFYHWWLGVPSTIFTP